MRNTDLAQRTRPRLQGTPEGQICAEVSVHNFSVAFFFCLRLFQSTMDVYRVYWPNTPLPVVVSEAVLQHEQPQQPQLLDSGAGIEMQPMHANHSASVSVDINVDVASRHQ
jgi:hypothetical protein